MNVVIMAGGGGTRLWPISRRDNPKQFFKFDGQTSLLEQTYQRVEGFKQTQQIFVATLEEYGERVRQLLPNVRPENIFYEPVRRDTTAAFAAIALRLKAQGRENEPTLFMWSDHIFTNEKEFITDLQKIPDLLNKYPDTIIMMGHIPIFPETGFGYIETGEKIVGYDDVYKVKSFKEKPDRAMAEKFLVAGTYFWNMGSFSFRPSYLLEELYRYEPAFGEQLDKFEQALRGNDEKKAQAIYSELPKIAIEYTVIERTPRIVVVTGDYGWSDIGNWSAVHDIFGVKGDHVPYGHSVHVDSANNYVYNTTDKVVSLIGLHDTIIVITEDAMLVTRKQDAHKVKEVVARLEKEGKTELL